MSSLGRRGFRSVRGKRGERILEPTFDRDEREHRDNGERRDDREQTKNGEERHENAERLPRGERCEIFLEERDER